MTKANELRLGNYILYSGDICIVDGIQYQDEALEYKHRVTFRCVANGIRSGKFVNWIMPIPITPELLELFGFIDPVSNGRARRLYLNETHELAWYLQDQQFYGESHVKYQTRGSGFSHDFGVKFVHQLQNLYFTITGEDLVLKGKI